MIQSLGEEDILFYGKYLSDINKAKSVVEAMIEEYCTEENEKSGSYPIESYKTRIKSAKSMKRKLLKSQLPITCEAAVTKLTDTIGIRIICRFTDDVFEVADWISKQTILKVIEVKDYIHNAKPNGYRSYHMITQLITENQAGIFVEIQIRTIAQDCWASLEHQMKYKKEVKNQKLIQKELKRCADEMAATDITMQTIRELIQER